jgi:PAS domain S-box-containing protein
MSRSVGPRLALRSRSLLWFAQFDWFVLYVATAAVVFFAFYPLLFFGSSPNRWSLGTTKSIPLGDLLTVILSLEAFLLIWLWLEMPRRRKAETVLKKMHSVQRAISRASGRIVSLKSEELQEGLQNELCAIGEMLEVDRISWFQQCRDGAPYARMQTSKVGEEIPAAVESPLSHLPWIADALLGGAPVRLRRLQDLPPEAEADRKALKAAGVKSLTMIPSSGGAEGVNALVLTSFTKELDWDEEVIAQMSVVASVIAGAYAKKAASDAVHASELKFRHLFEDSPIGIALLDSGGQMRMSNETLAQLLGYSREELKLKNILDVAYPGDVPQTWLQLQEVTAGVRQTSQTEKRFLRSDGSVIWGRMTLSLAGTESHDGPYLLSMIEDVTATNLAKEQLRRITQLLTLALESSRTIAWEYDSLAGTISWLDRNRLRAGGDKVPATDLISNVLSHVVVEDRDKLQGYADNILQTGGAFSAEFRMIGKDGTTRWMLGKGELLNRTGESVPRILGVTVDVSEVKRAQFQLEQLAKRLMEAQEEERKRISRELHDDIGQRVALLAIELDILRQQFAGEDKDELGERLEQLQASTSELGTDLHLLSHALHSSKLKHLGLESALRELCNRMNSKQGVLVELVCGNAPNFVTEDDALVLYRVAQEALNNVGRHSSATKATVALQCSETNATLVISDNGNGFDPAANSEGIGLVGMRERLRAVGGEFRIFSTPGAGTELYASVPLAKSIQDLDIARRAAAGSSS